MEPHNVGTPGVRGIRPDTIESTVYEREDKLDDQKHVFYKFVHQTVCCVQVL